MKKKVLSIVLAIVLATTVICGTTVFGAEYNNIQVKLNGRSINFDQPPIMVNDRVMVPLRATFEALGATVEWNEYNELIYAERLDTSILMGIGQPRIAKQVGSGDIRFIDLDVAPVLLNDRTLIPVRAVSEAFGCSVRWNDTAQTVNIYTDGYVGGSTLGGSQSSQSYDLYDEDSDSDSYGGSSGYSGSSITDSSVHKKCSYCGGSGKVKCTNCNGSGKVTVRVSVPNYSGKRGGGGSSSETKTCSSCSGSGKKNCNFCGGDGVQ